MCWDITYADEDGTVTAEIDALAQLLAGVLQTDPADLDPARNVTDFGLDSLLGRQFLVRARDLPGVRLSPADLATGRTLAHFARPVHQRLEPAAGEREWTRAGVHRTCRGPGTAGGTADLSGARTAGR
ncbi:acyl carrier protein [Streptomyces viridosporus]|uniref:acyl carrier protein n=1 Tax=Streptomyces viridosporus TaxID=67581 RepID=UPI0036F69461